MIEKLKITASDTAIILKINELVDTVNSLRDDCNLLMGYIAPEDGSRPTVAKNASVTESSQEEYNWVGCLCELWSGNSKNHRYGILRGLAKNTYKGHKIIHKYQALSMSFEHCEPIKPDDDIIYKGGDNE